MEDGTVVEGANQENAAYPSGLCAERTALFHAGVAKAGKAVAARNQGSAFTLDPIAPCGACRQVMLESQVRGKRKILIFLYVAGRILKASSVEDLLPLTFTKESMQPLTAPQRMNRRGVPGESLKARGAFHHGRPL